MNGSNLFKILMQKKGVAISEEQSMRLANFIAGMIRVHEFIKKDRDDLRSKMAEMGSQEPIGLVKTVGGYPDESEHTVKWLVKHRHITDGQHLYAKPIPADKPAMEVPDCITEAIDWLKASVECANFQWDADQLEAAKFALDASLKYLAATPDDNPAMALPKNFQDAIVVLKENLRDKDRGVKACGMRDNDQVRDALNTLLSDTSHNQQSI